MLGDRKKLASFQENQCFFVTLATPTLLRVSRNRASLVQSL